MPIEAGGVARRSELLRQGLTVNEIDQARRHGELQRVRWGWYSLPGADPAVIRAVKAGTVLSCVSSLKRHDVWTRDSQHLHTRQTEYRQRHKRVRYRNDIKVCMAAERESRPCAGPVDSIRDALLTMLECRPGWELTAAMDSLLNRNRTTHSELWDLLGHRGGKAVKALSQMDERRESGSETRFQLALESEQISYQMQVRLLGYRVDTLIGRRLIVELDGWSAHGTRKAFENDRERDRRLAAAGFHVIRLTHQQTMEQLEAAMVDIRTLIRRREHLRRVPL
ncbi:DUF559 domain-containing protein [Agrococcus casei]|uniref:DUF559 domain-containing protein n=1 Tax=Agrococcus casei TaxID=343512 RepID=UPI003F933F73